MNELHYDKVNVQMEGIAQPEVRSAAGLISVYLALPCVTWKDKNYYTQSQYNQW